MNNLVLYKGVYISKEQYDDIKNMRQLSDEEIDLSDIPEITHEEFKRMKENRRRRKNLQQAS
ncbi:MAG: hypothetical protein IJS29_07655 [Selenomonadaceae bacterium]|nr:hypothetical protein [Selenomonadaceae bacterium]